MQPNSRQFLDDRGRGVPLPDVRSLDELEEHDAALEILLSRINPCDPGMQTPLTGGQVAWLCLSGLFWVPLWWVLRHEPFYVKASVTGGAIAALLALGTWYRGRWLAKGSRELRVTVLEMQRCPSCLHPLDGLPLQADSCVICPECGGAWRPSGVVHSARAAELPPVS